MGADNTFGETNFNPDKKNALAELLAILHGDGGHYQQEHGTTKAIEDAINLIHTKWFTNGTMQDINELLRDNKELKTKLQNVVDACEDKDGQFRAWHQHLRKCTTEAKELLPSKIN